MGGALPRTEARLRYLLDTHVLVWWTESHANLTRAHRRVLSRAAPSAPLFVSDISLWEVAMLCDLGRLRPARPLRDWLEMASAPPLVERIGIPPAVAAEVAALPPTFHRDPADRILVATARVIGATLLTVDRRIIESELVATL